MVVIGSSLTCTYIHINLPVSFFVLFFFWEKKEIEGKRRKREVYPNRTPMTLSLFSPSSPATDSVNAAKRRRKAKRYIKGAGTAYSDQKGTGGMAELRTKSHVSVCVCGGGGVVGGADKGTCLRATCLTYLQYLKFRLWNVNPMRGDAERCGAMRRDAEGCVIGYSTLDLVFGFFFCFFVLFFGGGGGAEGTGGKWLVGKNEMNGLVGKNEKDGWGGRGK